MRLSDAVQQNPEAVDALRRLVERGDVQGVSFEQAMEFLLSDGILPDSGLPLSSFLYLEDWARRRLGKDGPVERQPR
jgi:hypothetical protein